MAKINTIGVDLAKNVIQVSVVSPSEKELQNKELTRTKFAEFMAKQKPALVAFESCATAHYWSRYAREHDHQTKIIPAKAVARFRQGHKTDKNDALAVLGKSGTVSLSGNASRQHIYGAKIDLSVVSLAKIYTATMCN